MQRAGRQLREALRGGRWGQRHAPEAASLEQVSGHEPEVRNTAVSPHARNLALLVGAPDLPEAVGDVATDDTANSFALRSVTSSVCGRICQAAFRGR